MGPGGGSGPPPLNGEPLPQSVHLQVSIEDHVIMAISTAFDKASFEDQPREAVHGKGATYGFSGSSETPVATPRDVNHAALVNLVNSSIHSKLTSFCWNALQFNVNVTSVNHRDIQVGPHAAIASFGVHSGGMFHVNPFQPVQIMHK